MAKQNIIRKAIEATGSFRNAAKACGVAVNAVTGWAKHGRLPWTDLVGFTGYAEALAEAGKHQIYTKQILEATSAQLYREHQARSKREKRKVAK